MEEFFSTILECASKANPLYAIVPLAVWYLFGGRAVSFVRGLFARKGVDPDAWLEAHPLLDRVWVNVKAGFTHAIANGKTEDEAYIALLKALQDAASRPKGQ